MQTSRSNRNTIAIIELRLASKKITGKYTVFLPLLLEAKMRVPLWKAEEETPQMKPGGTLCAA